MPAFKDSVIRIIKSIPAGKVMSYGQVALVAGQPRMARQVGWVLNGLTETELVSQSIPWWRVLNRDGIITIKGNTAIDSAAHEQRRLLLVDKTPFLSDFQVDIKNCRFIPD